MTTGASELALIVLSAGGLLTFGIIAIRQKDLVRAVISYGVASAFLAAQFFLLTSPFAAMLELTVGAGLIVVLFLVALTLSSGSEDQPAEIEEVQPIEGKKLSNVAKNAAAGILCVLIVSLFISIILRPSLEEPESISETVAPALVLWEDRDFETILQGLLILCGVFAILMLLRAARLEAEG